MSEETKRVEEWRTYVLAPHRRDAHCFALHLDRNDASAYPWFESYCLLRHGLDDINDALTSPYADIGAYGGIPTLQGAVGGLRQALAYLRPHLRWYTDAQLGPWKMDFCILSGTLFELSALVEEMKWKEALR